MPITKQELRDRLIAIHTEAAPDPFDYHSYAEAIGSDLDDLLKDLGLADRYVVEATSDENDYYDGFKIRPRVQEVNVPDVGDWSDTNAEELAKPKNIEEAVEFWWKLAETKRLEE